MDICMVLISGVSEKLTFLEGEGCALLCIFRMLGGDRVIM
jgi:hypothetical protein